MCSSEIKGYPLKTIFRVITPKIIPKLINKLKLAKLQKKNSSVLILSLYKANTKVKNTRIEKIMITNLKYLQNITFYFFLKGFGN